MSDSFKGVEPMVYNSKISVPYHWWAGETAGKFLRSLKDDKKIIGTKCSKCNKVYTPPRKTCPACFIENTEWVDLSGEGTLVSYTVTRRQLAAIPKDKKVPVIYGLVKLEGSDTAMLHFIEGISPEEVEIGLKVKAEFAESDETSVRAISCFKPV